MGWCGGEVVVCGKVVGWWVGELMGWWCGEVVE